MRSLPTGVRRKVHALELQRAQLDRLIARNPEKPAHVTDMWKAQRAGVDFAIEVIEANFAEAVQVLRRRREEAGTL